MSISNAMSNALSGLTAASRMAEVISSNLANATTDGYGRRSVALSAATVGGRGSGVQIDGITRFVNRGVLADRRQADAGMAGFGQATTTLSRVERLVGAAGEQNALTTQIAALESALAEAGSDPSSDVRLQTVVSRFGAVTTSLNQSAEGIQNLRREAESSIASQVETLNTSLRQVQQLNTDIARTQGARGDASALLDARQKVVDTIAAIVPLRELDRSGGQIALMSTAGVMLVDGPARQFGFQPVNTVTADMTLASGGLNGVTVDGAPVDPGNGIGGLKGGSLGAAFALRDGSLVTAQTGLDAVARDLIERFQSAADPTLASGDAGLLTDAGAAFDPANTAGLSARIRVNAAIDPARGGALFRLRDGINAAAPGPVGNAAQIDAWLDALATARPSSNGGSAASAAGHAGQLMSDVSGSRLAAEESLSFASARWDTLRQAELADGVDSDQELQLLLKVEQSYSANARLIQTVEAMMQTLMEL